MHVNIVNFGGHNYYIQTLNIMKHFVLTCFALLAFLAGFAQTIDELKAEQSAKKDSIDALQGRVDDLQGQIDALPGWKIGAFATIGFSLSKANNWYSQGTPNNSSGNIGVTVNAFANLDREKFTVAYWLSRRLSVLPLPWRKPMSN